MLLGRIVPRSEGMPLGKVQTDPAAGEIHTVEGRNVARGAAAIDDPHGREGKPPWFLEGVATLKTRAQLKLLYL